MGVFSDQGSLRSAAVSRGSVKMGIQELKVKLIQCFTKDLLCARHLSRPWGFGAHQTATVSPPTVMGRGEINQITPLK